MCLSPISSILRLLRSLQCREFSISFLFHFILFFFVNERWTILRMLKFYNWFLSTMQWNKRKISNERRIVKDLNYTAQIDLVILFFSISEFEWIYKNLSVSTYSNAIYSVSVGLSSSIIAASISFMHFSAIRCQNQNINWCRRTKRVQWKCPFRKNLRFFQIIFHLLPFMNANSSRLNSRMYRKLRQFWCDFYVI